MDRSVDMDGSLDMDVDEAGQRWIEVDVEGVDGGMDAVAWAVLDAW